MPMINILGSSQPSGLKWARKVFSPVSRIPMNKIAMKLQIASITLRERLPVADPPQCDRCVLPVNRLQDVANRNQAEHVGKQDEKENSPDVIDVLVGHRAQVGTNNFVTNERAHRLE